MQLSISVRRRRLSDLTTPSSPLVLGPSAAARSHAGSHSLGPELGVGRTNSKKVDQARVEPADHGRHDRRSTKGRSLARGRSPVPVVSPTSAGLGVLLPFVRLLRLKAQDDRPPATSGHTHATRISLRSSTCRLPRPLAGRGQNFPSPDVAADALLPPHRPDRHRQRIGRATRHTHRCTTSTLLSSSH